MIVNILIVPSYDDNQYNYRVYYNYTNNAITVYWFKVIKELFNIIPCIYLK